MIDWSLPSAAGSCACRSPAWQSMPSMSITYDGGCRLNAHIVALPAREPSPGQWTALVIGGGLTGIEAAAELPGKLRAVLDGMVGTPRVTLADRQPWIGSD